MITVPVRLARSQCVAVLEVRGASLKDVATKASDPVALLYGGATVKRLSVRNAQVELRAALIPEGRYPQDS